MSRGPFGRGNCYDNAPMESFFALLKMEPDHDERYRTRQEARTSLFNYIECFYTRQRIHSAIQYLSPVDFEAMWSAQLSITKKDGVLQLPLLSTMA